MAEYQKATNIGVDEINGHIIMYSTKSFGEMYDGNRIQADKDIEVARNFAHHLFVRYPYSFQGLCFHDFDQKADIIIQERDDGTWRIEE